MSRSPENAWRMLAQMSPDALRSKLLLWNLPDKILIRCSDPLLREGIFYANF